jgi:hypothetical protein
MGKVYKKEDLLVVPRNSKSSSFILSHSVKPGDLNLLWYKVKDKWINTGDRTCIISGDQVPTDMKSTPMDLGMLSIDRNAVEDNWQFQQIVVGLIIRSGAKMFLFKCKKGDMQERITMVQGHVNATRAIVENMPFGEVLRANIVRELLEEVKIPSNRMAKELMARCMFDERFSPKLKFMTYDVLSNQSNISRYHIGYIFDIAIPTEYQDILKLLSSNEPHLNTSYIADITKDDLDNADSWLTEIINYYRLYGNLK